MNEPLFEFLRHPASLSLPALLFGSGIFLIVGGMGLFALLGLPLLHGLGLAVGFVRRLAQGTGRVGPWRRMSEPDRPLCVDGLSPALARLAQQTRTLALELRRRSEEARRWSEDAAEIELVSGRWWSSLVFESIDVRPQLDTRRDVFEWLDSVAGLPASDRQRLVELGIDSDAVRSALTSEQAVADSVRTLAGLLWAIDERLAGGVSPGYRVSGADRASSVVPSRRPSSDDDEELDANARMRRFSTVVASQRRGLSRMASSYASSPSEREDLEQDIALALWQALPRFRGESSIETFAYRVARYCCFRHLRRRAKQRSEAVGELGSVSDPDACLESWLLHTDELVRVEQARERLPDNLETTLSLHLAGLSYSEIAERLGISEQNVSVRLTRARHRIRAQLVTA